MDEIAIIGMSCLYPDYVTLEDFWDRMMAGLSFTATDRFMGRDIERASMPRGRADEFFRARFRPEEMAQMDDMGDLFKWTTYITREALRQAGYLEKFQPLSRTGLVMGVFGMPAWEYTNFFDNLVRMSTQQTINFLMGGDTFEFDYQTPKRLQPRAILLDTEPSIFVAEKFRLGGPVTNINVACSTPVYAMQLATMYLLQGKADMMLAGAQCYNQMDLAISGLFDLLGILAAPGENKPFDKNSKGVIAGSGAGMFLLKRLSDARRDGDTILGIIERIGWSNDGGRRSILAPDADGQILSYEDAYRADLSPDVDYIECHATGTVAGDWTEIDSITRYFRSRGVDPLLGALKGNTGHFFTASTHAAIAKVLLAMQKAVIPMTNRIEDPIDPRIVTQNTPWPDRGRAKRAAVNSFGFGGTNAHLVLREYVPALEPQNPESRRRPSYAYVPMDITGLGMVVGEIGSVADYIRILCQGRSAVQEVRKIRWHALQQHPDLLREMHLTAMPRGAYICDFDFDFMDYKFPVSGNEYWLRKDFLLLKATDEAIRDAGLRRGENARTSVIVNFSQDFSEMNFMASLELRDAIMPALEKNYPDLSRAQLEELWTILRENELRRDAAGTVPGMMPNIRASRVAARWGFHGPAMAIADRENGFARALEIAQYLLTENMVDHVVVGSAELVGEQEHIYVQELLGNIDAIRALGIGEGAVALVLSRAGESGAAYAQVGGVAITRPVGEPQARIRMGISDALLQADMGKDDIGIVELPESAQPEMREAYFELFRAGFFSSRAVWDSVERSTGFAMSLTGGIALIKAALEISGGVRFIERAGRREPWGDPVRTALVNSFSRDGSAAHVALRASSAADAQKRLRPEGFLLPVSARTPKELIEKLGQLRLAVSKKGPAASFQAAWEAPREALCLCLIARDKESLLEEIDQALKRADAFAQPGYIYESAGGSYYTASPMGPRGKIVYMCPPGGMWNASRFFETLTRFPDLRKFYMDFVQGDFMAHRDVRGQRLEAFMMELPAVRLAVDILREKLTIAPDMVVGASMGELAPLFALGSIEYDAPNTLASLMAELTQVLSDLFSRELPDWESFYIKGDQAELSKCLEAEPDVHRIILGSPMDAVILGEREACRRVLSSFSGLGTRAEDVTVIHTPLASPLYACSGGEAFGEKVRLKADLSYAMYTTRDRAPLRPEAPDAFARSFRHILTEPSDFSDTLLAAYADGGRVFIDLSTGGVCQAWAAEALRGRDALILPLYPSAAEPEAHFLKLLGRLMAHGVPMDAARAKEMFAFQVSDRPRLVRKVPMSIQGSIDRISDPANRERVLRAGGGAAAEDRQIPPAATAREPLPGTPDSQGGDTLAATVAAALALSQVTSTGRVTQDAPQSTAVTSQTAIPALQDIADTPQADAVAPQAVPDTPKASAIAPQASAIAPQASALAPQAAPIPAQSASSAPQPASQSPKPLPSPEHLLDAVFRARALHLNARAYQLYTRYESALLAALLRPAPAKPAAPARPCLWDLPEILEMTAGSMARVLGPRYAAVDRYRVRARLPMPPFLFVSRITAIDAEYGVYRPSSIDIEYDIEEDCLLIMGSMISHIVITESAQIGIFLMAYIGIDDLSGGTLRFRIADTKVTIHGDIPGVGETFKGRYQILSFMKNGATTLVTSRFTCTVNGRPVLTLDAIGGFFTEQDLESSKGVIEKGGAAKGNPARPSPLPQNDVTSYTQEQLRPFYAGEFTGYAPKGQFISPDHFFKIRPISEKVFLVDRIEKITSRGGKYGLGEIIAHKDIDETHWAFQVHFLGDPVYPGSLLLEAVNQLAYFFLLHTGLIARTRGGVAYPRRNSPVSCAFRGQVRPVASTITYHLRIRDFVDEPGNVYFAYDADIYWQGIHVVKGENLSVCIEGE